MAGGVKADFVLNLEAVVAAAASAWLWWRASRLSRPPVTTVSYAGEGPFNDAAKLQASLNARAAGCAAIAAACQAFAIALKL